MENVVSSVIVTFNPPVETLQNVAVLAGQMSRVVIVDNTPASDATSVLTELERLEFCTVIRNQKNLGIAEALNIGIRQAISIGCEWIFTLDQDSQITDGYVEKMLSAHEQTSKYSRVGMVFPAYRDVRRGNTISLPKSAKGGVLVGMTSGALLHKDVFNLVGPMESDPSLGGVFSDAELIDATSRPIGIRLWPSILFPPREQKRFRSGRGIDVLLKRNVVTGATLMVRANLRHLFIPVPAVWVHDGWIAFLMVAYSRLGLIEERLIQYRIHPNQQVGLAELGSALPPTLRERLEKGKREEPAKHAAHAKQLEELERWMDGRKDTVPPGLRRAIRFYEGLAKSTASRPANIGWLLRNTGNYRRYEDGWKSLARDIVLQFV